MPVAALQSGATAMRSRATSQMHTYGPNPTTIESAESAQPRYVSALRRPAKSSSRATAPRLRGDTSPFWSIETSYLQDRARLVCPVPLGPLVVRLIVIFS